MFDPEGSSVINAMLYITVGVSKYLEIMSKLDLDISIKYTERILRGRMWFQYIATRPIMYLCEETVWRSGVWVSMRW